ncbi:holin, partial [Escherichia coli]
MGRLRRLHELSEPSVVNWWLFYCCQLPDNGRRGMYQMEKITTGVSYTTSAV